jgi:hypothetical protein
MWPLARSDWPKVRLPILMFVFEWLLVALSLKFSITMSSSLETGAQKWYDVLVWIFWCNTRAYAQAMPSGLF